MTPTAESGSLEYMHGISIALLHLSAAEFIFARDGELGRVDTLSREEARRRACASIPVVQMLGCGCQSLVGEVNKFLNHNESDSKTSRLFRRWVQVLTQPRSVQTRHSCARGFYHPVYETVDQTHLRTNCPDFIGLAAFSGGYQIAIDILKGIPRRVSSYYRGYLVICAARGLWIQASSQWSKVNAHLKLINWLTMNEANLLIPHVVDVGLGTGCLVARSPITECWLSMFRLAEWLGSSLWTLLDTRELDALLTALNITESMPGVPMYFVVGNFRYYVVADFGVSAGFKDGHIIIEAEVNHFGKYCAAKLASLQEPACTTSNQPEPESPPKLSQIAKIISVSGQLSPPGGVDGRRLSVAERISLLDAIEVAPTHDPAGSLDTLIQEIWRRFHGQKRCLGSVRSVLAEHSRRLCMTDYYGQHYSYLVPPDLYRGLDEQTWYEQGELREGMIWRDEK